MKKITLCIAAFALMAITTQVNAQTETKKEIRKEVNVEEVNGEKVLTISTTENGNTKKEIFKGAEADKKMAELKQHKSGTTKTMVIGEDGKKHLKVEKKVVITHDEDK